MTKKCTKKETNKMTYKDALYIGAFQALALIPGISRSGATISAGIFRNIDRELAAKFSFLLFIPAIIGATILEYSSFSFEASELPAIIVGFLVTVLVSYFVIYWLLKLVKKGKLYYFSYYCAALGIITLILSL
jgi:undecaprenyl-diphosphatase